MRRRYVCLGWAESAGNCTAKPRGERGNPWLCDTCDREREEDMRVQTERRRAMRAEAIADAFEEYDG